MSSIYVPQVFRWAGRAGLRKEDAADVVQEVFRTLVTKICVFDHTCEGATFRGYLRGITRWKIGDWLRVKRGMPPAQGGSEALKQLLSIPEDRSDEDITQVESDLVINCRQALDLIRCQFEDRTWQAFWLTSVENLTAAEVSSRLGMSVTSVYTAKSRVLRRLRIELGELDDRNGESDH